jgi:hypothetical protein
MAQTPAVAGTSEKGLTGADAALKRLLVQFSEAAFLEQPPPRDIHDFAEAYFTRAWNRVKLNAPPVGTTVIVVDPLEKHPRRTGKVVAVNRVSNSLDVLFPDGSREAGIPREYTSTDLDEVDLSAHDGKSAAELQAALARPIPGFRALMVAFVVNVAKLEHPPGDVRKYAAEYFRTLKEVKDRQQKKLLATVVGSGGGGGRGGEGGRGDGSAEGEGGDPSDADGSRPIGEIASTYPRLSSPKTAPGVSPMVAAKQDTTQRDWFVRENAKLASTKFRTWMQTAPEGQQFMNLAQQHYAAERSQRVRAVSRRFFCALAVYLVLCATSTGVQGRCPRHARQRERARGQGVCVAVAASVRGVC